ncbi:PREDICTED: uncharacterized protein LOC105361402 [Ceratosolen solmsi marchali]|uniref:Uncharacterized protein LOC105361402 n=1 Tax=Ceratosolen solmsi marchali TaxID=326594 RepID=A0AAJ6YF12_9HYME|nr:PREDICTED: uncharacterized protein LOC105361402 [Ceratosolen solmsi marchali]
MEKVDGAAGICRRTILGKVRSDSRQVLACLAMLMLPIAGKQPESSGALHCGGHLTARRGIIATPNFPGPFAVPINCRWILDASAFVEHANASIIVYLSQLYAARGLRFTEYAYFETESTSFGGALLREIDEGNVFEHRWLRTFRPYLVLDFRLERLEANHVRVLDKLLDVYGFNFTYEMTDGRENPSSCSLRDCSYAGDCLLTSDYATFYCDCFEGFGGQHCGYGPLCVTERGNPKCQNGGTCRHVGAAAVRCLCKPQFNGDVCEMSSLISIENGCRKTNCVFQCSFLEDEQHKQPPCECKKSFRIHSDRTRFECRIKLMNVTYPRGVNFIGQKISLETHLSKQLAKYIWESNISSLEELKILSMTPALEVNFHFFGDSRDGDKIRSAFNKLVHRRRLGQFFLEPSHFTFQQKPALRLQSLRINQVNEHQVQLGDQFIVTCVAVGSSDLKFFWYKDNMLVNVTKATRKIWYRHLPTDGSDYHTSILSVDKAMLLDKGVYTCQVVDWGMQQCKSIQIDIKDDPNVEVIPMGITVDKGTTIRLVCTTPNMRNVGIGFGWTKNRALLKLEPGQEVWEDLYPAGSILTIIHAQKSAVYTCNVAHHSSSVRVEVVNRTLIPVCPDDINWNLNWRDTAPGLKSLLQCPIGFVGRHASRQCTMKDAANSEWEIPDFSDCLYEPFLHPYNNFQSLTLGYESTNSSSTIQAFWDILQYRTSPLYPGEGDRIIAILQEIQHYQYNVNELEDMTNSADAIIKISDRILGNDYSILNQQNLALLSQLILRNLGYWSQNNAQNQKHLSLSEIVVNILPMKVYADSTIMYSLNIPQDNQNKYPDWYNERVTIRLYHNKLQNVNKSISGIVIVYRNLTQFFPDTYIIELDDGSDMEYRINSRIISVKTSYRDVERDDRLSIELEFAGARNHPKAWNVSCGVLGASGNWKLGGCSLMENPFKASVLNCLCSSPGTYAAFITTRPEKVILIKNDQTNFVVILGCSSCLLQCLVSILILTAFWWRNRTWLNFLKIECCAAIIVAMGTFIYAVNSKISENALSIVAMCLEAFLLIGTSSPISQALIIYTELSNIHPSQQLQPTVVAVITGLPILAILTTELTRKTIGWKHESWWLIFGTGVYNIFIICSITLLLTFLLLYVSVIQKTRPSLYKFKKKSIIKLRIRMLHRSAIVIFGIVAMEISSVLYVNSSSIIYHYLFAFQSALLGFIILAMYVMSGEVLVVAPVLHKLKRQTESDDECTSEQTEVHSKYQERERDLSSSPSGTAMTIPASLLLGAESVAVYPEARGVAVGIETHEYITEIPAGSYIESMHTHSTPEIQVHHVDNLTFDESNLSYQPLRRYGPTSGFATFETCATSEYTNPHNELVSFSGIRVTATSTTTTATMTTELHQLQHRERQLDFPTKILCDAQVETCLVSGKTLTMPDVTLSVNGNADNHGISVTSEQTFIRKQVNGKEVITLSVSSSPPLLTTITTSNIMTTTTTTTTTPSMTMPDIANTMERKQPECEDVMLKTFNKQCGIIVNEDDQSLTTNGMLDRISHDLDYLLNRTKDDTKTVDTTKQKLLFPETLKR